MNAPPAPPPCGPVTTIGWLGIAEREAPVPGAAYDKVENPYVITSAAPRYICWVKRREYVMVKSAREEAAEY